MVKRAFRVLVTDHVFNSLEITREVLQPLHTELVLASSTDELSLSRLANEADAIMVCYAKITQTILEAASKGGCRIVARSGIGLDNIDITAATKLGILVTHVPDYCLDEVADHTIGLLLTVARGIFFAGRTVEIGGWSVPDTPVHRLRGRQLTLLGIGRIGRRVATRAAALGLSVVGFDPVIKTWDLEGVRRATSLAAALENADFVSLHAPMTPANHHLIGKNSLAMMHRAPVLINTARGALIDMAAVVDALDDGTLSALALDVTEVEPLPLDHSLRRHPKAVVTPHIAYFSIEAQDELQQRTADELLRALSGFPPRCPVNPQVLDPYAGRSA